MRAFKKRQITAVFLVCSLLLLLMTPQLQSFYYLQEKQRFTVGQPLEIPLKLPPVLQKAIDVYIRDGERLLALEGQNNQEARYLLGVNAPVGVEPGKVSLELKLFGVIPLKKINVDVLPDIQLIPGGHSIGVLLRTEGVMVIGYSPVLNRQNEACFPARQADVRIGDVILEVNGIKVLSDDQVGRIIAETRHPEKGITLKISREGKILQRVVYPQFCEDTKTYRIGLFVRDNAGGVGTLTFFDPRTKKFGALGHVITDSETNQKLNIRQGKILAVSVESIQKGESGSPGEKIGIFLEDTEFGSIEKNETCGVYGTMHQDLTNEHYSYPLPIGFSNQLRTGKAEILTVVKGQQIRKYEIQIEKILFGKRDGKNMIIRITDPELLQITGGIVQGMSGSPIIQDGRIVGAVTHVFVNDPPRGYGVFIENMLFEAGLLDSSKQILGFAPRDLFTYGVKILELLEEPKNIGQLPEIVNIKLRFALNITYNVGKNFSLNIFF